MCSLSTLWSVASEIPHRMAWKGSCDPRARALRCSRRTPSTCAGASPDRTAMSTASSAAGASRRRRPPAAHHSVLAQRSSLRHPSAPQRHSPMRRSLASAGMLSQRAGAFLPRGGCHFSNQCRQHSAPQEWGSVKVFFSHTRAHELELPSNSVGTRSKTTVPFPLCECRGARTNLPSCETSKELSTRISVEIAPRSRTCLEAT